MSTTNDASTDDKTPKEEIVVKVESDTEESVNTETQSTEEDTSLNNETSEPVSRDEKRSAGEVIANLGNEKKQIASNLVSLAKSNEEARKQVKEMLLNDPSTASYLKTKFGSDYDFITGEESIEKQPEVDVEKIKEQAMAQAQAEAIKAQMQLNHEKMLKEKAKELGFTAQEFDLYKEKVELLGGDEKALNDAALIVNQAKATAKSGEYVPDEGEAPKPSVKEVTITPGLNAFSESRGLDTKDFASDISRVKGLHRKDVHGKPVMDLPSL